MKRFRLMLGLIALAISMSFAFKLSGQSTRQGDLSLMTSQTLEAENARLCARVRELEDRVKQLEDERRSLRRTLYFDAKQDLRLRADPQDLPPGSQTHQYNGITYYVFPLSEHRITETHLKNLRMISPVEDFLKWNPRTMPAEIYPRLHGAQHGDLIDDRGPPTSRTAKSEK